MRLPAIALEKIVALEPVCHRACVPAEWSDANGHMNVRWYQVLYDVAADDLHDRMGLTPAFHDQHGTGTMDLEHHLNFLNEVMPGETVAVYARLVALSAKRLQYLMFVVNESRGNLASVFECMNAFVDKKLRRMAPFPPEIVALIEPWLEKDSRLDWAPPVSGAMRV